MPLVLSAEQQQEQLEHVEEVEKDRGRQQRRGPEVLAAAKALEVEGRQPGEDHQTNDCVDHRAARDLREGRW
jgi:hypothetical protein